MKKYTDIKTAVIGGSGIYNIEAAEVLDEININTPFGKPSDLITVCSIEGKKIAFLPRHGRGHFLLPGELPVRANIWALKSLGVQKIIAVSAVGSLKEEIAPCDFVMPDQIIDRTHGRESTFFGNGIVGHISFAEPFCSCLRSNLLTTLKNKSSVKIHERGIYVCMQGPAFSTRAESLLHKNWGASVIGMTALPEAKLAREAEMCYALIAMSTDYDCWKEEEKGVTLEMVIRHMNANVAEIKNILPALIKNIPEDHNCACTHAARDAIFTDRKKISGAVRKRLDLLYGKYL